MGQQLGGSTGDTQAEEGRVTKATAAWGWQCGGRGPGALLSGGHGFQGLKPPTAGSVQLPLVLEPQGPCRWVGASGVDGAGVPG